MKRHNVRQILILSLEYLAYSNTKCFIVVKSKINIIHYLSEQPKQYKQ